MRAGQRLAAVPKPPLLQVEVSLELKSPQMGAPSPACATPAPQSTLVVRPPLLTADVAAPCARAQTVHASGPRALPAQVPARHAACHTPTRAHHARVTLAAVPTCARALRGDTPCFLEGSPETKLSPEKTCLRPPPPFLDQILVRPFQSTCLGELIPEMVRD